MPYAGEDRWLAIAVQTGAQWQALCAVIGRPDLAADLDLATLDGGLRWTGQVDRAVTDWAAQDSITAAGILRQAKVPPTGTTSKPRARATAGQRRP